MIQVLYFASLREQLGTAREEIEPFAALSVAELRRHLQERGGVWAEALSGERRIMAAVNQEVASPDTPIGAGDEVAFFPPVTGG